MELLVPLVRATARRTNCAPTLARTGTYGLTAKILQRHSKIGYVTQRPNKELKDSNIVEPRADVKEKLLTHESYI